jgi:hypothetical protein
MGTQRPAKVMIVGRIDTGTPPPDFPLRPLTHEDVEYYLTADHPDLFGDVTESEALTEVEAKHDPEEPKDDYPVAPI